MVNDEFQKQPLWEVDNHIKLDDIRLGCGDIGLTIQWYEHCHGIVESDLVYRFYYSKFPQIQIHNQLMHGKFVMTQGSGIKDKRRSARHKTQLVVEYEKIIELKLNGSKNCYNKLSK